MTPPDDWTDRDFVPRDGPPPAPEADARERYEQLLRGIRYLLRARADSFTWIAETLVSVGLPAGPVGQLVEAVVQSLQGCMLAPDAYPQLAVPAAAFAALGLPPPGKNFDRQLYTPGATTSEPNPEFGFAKPADATQSKLEHDARPTSAILVVLLVALALAVIFTLSVAF
jgi:hypothetical protein